MITIAGVVLSMTLVALSLASSQLGPRLLRSFMRDSATQAVLGTFIATFLSCLLVLRTIRRTEAAAFVPHLSVTLGVLLAVASVGVLIYFVHHVSVSIQANENDPFTAMTCVDHLGAALSRLTARDTPSPYHQDAHRRVRVIADGETFADVTDAAFNQIRQHGRSSAAVTIRLLETTAVISGFTHRDDRKQ